MYAWWSLTSRGFSGVKTYRMTSTTMGKPMETLIRQKLTQALDPQHLDVSNESYMHNVPKGSETHFKVVVVSDKFEEQTLIKRHRMVNDALQQELMSGLHALSIVAMTRSQWENSDKTVKPSPVCRGGFGR